MLHEPEILARILRSLATQAVKTRTTATKCFIRKRTHIRGATLKLMEEMIAGLFRTNIVSMTQSSLIGNNFCVAWAVLRPSQLQAGR